MTVQSYNMGGDLDLCARESDRDKFLESAKKLAVQRNVSLRTIILWCYQRADSLEMMERIKGWIAEKDVSQEWLMSLPEYELVEG